MKRTVWLWELFGFSVVSLFGTVLHFLYEWLGEAGWIASFSGVNESTWEHMKLLFWPMLIFAVVESFFFREYKTFWCVKTRGILIGLCLIPIIFYTYNGVIGKSPDWVNIAIFFVSAAVTFIYETRALNSEENGNGIRCNSTRVAVSVLLLLALSFVIFTFITPSLNIFRDPVTDSYGIRGTSVTLVI